MSCQQLLFVIDSSSDGFEFHPRVDPRGTARIEAAVQAPAVGSVVDDEAEVPEAVVARNRFLWGWT